MKRFKQKGAQFVPTNITGGSKNMRNFLIESWKEVDVVSVWKSLKGYQNSDGCIYICVNNNTGGQHLPLRTLINFWSKIIVETLNPIHQLMLLN